MQRRTLCALVALMPALGRADGIAIVGGSPRAIGRAGAATVGDDGGGALIINPGAMARRDTTRVELGTAMIDDTVQWRRNALASPISAGRAGSRLVPLGAAIGAIGEWVIGIGVMTASLIDRSMPIPMGEYKVLKENYYHYYDYRYAGISGSYRRDTLALGVARRFGDSLALGLSVGASRVAVKEHRQIWAGLGDPHVEGAAFDDVDLAFSATDPFVASAVAGVLYAPVDSQIELGASVAWTQTVRASGTVQAADTGLGAMVVSDMPRASLDVRQPIAARAGGRYVGDRVAAELDGDLWISPSGSGSTSWRVDGVSVTDPTQVTADLRNVPSRISQHTHLALRTAVDVAVIPGFLWAIGGYAFSTRATPSWRLSPSFGDLGGHTLGLGLETAAGGFTVTLGWSRTWALRTDAPTELKRNNAFDRADLPVEDGSYDGSIDQVGVLIEAELGGR